MTAIRESTAARRDDVEVVVVGGGPAGAAIAARLAAAGRDVTIFERSPAWRWRACGVFSSPATMTELRDLDLADANLQTVARPIPRMWIEAPHAAPFALTYGDAGRGPTAVGFDRSRLDPLLLERAVAAGARVCRGTTVIGLDQAADGRWLVCVRDAAGVRELGARIVVGADGVRSKVARLVGAARTPQLTRIGLTYHVPDGRLNSDGAEMDGRMVVLNGAYCGLAPVPGGRINVGIVVASRELRSRLVSKGARDTAAAILRRAGGTAATPLDHVEGIAPIAQRVTRRAGRGWLLVGDAAGFIDPFTGEGLHRALVSARLGAQAVERELRGRPALADYDASMRRRFLAKDLLSWLVQLFLARPGLFDYAARRAADRPAVRARIGLLMGDLAPASGAFDPRFMAALLAP